MIKKTPFNNIIATVDAPLLKSLSAKAETITTAFTIKKLILQYGIDGSGTIIEVNHTEPVTIETTIDPRNHSHTYQQLPASVDAKPNTVALRDTSGNLKSSDASLTHTGYKIANGTDLAVLFKTTNDVYVTVSTQAMSGGNTCSYAQLVKQGNQIILQTYWASYCSFWAYCRCQCCCD